MLMTWTFNMSERAINILDKFADVMEQVGIFNFTVNRLGVVSGEIPVRINNIIAKYPNVSWLLTIQNEGTKKDIVEAILNNTEGAREVFLSEVKKLIEKYPYCSGIDIDFENCGGNENRFKMKQLVSDIFFLCKQNEKKLNVCMPPITGPGASVGGEYWCYYEDYGEIVDTMSIMSYAFAWLGSAPGPVSPKWWLEQILDYAIKVVPREKIIIGLGAWAIMWGLHMDYEKYRAVSGTYYWALQWMEGKTNFYDFNNGEGVTWWDRQSKIPFTGYWDDYSKVCYLLPHVYDFVNGDMYSNLKQPLVIGIQDNRGYAVSFSKLQIVEGEFSTVSKVYESNGCVVYGNGYMTSSKKTILSTEEWEYLKLRFDTVGFDNLTENEKKLYQSTQAGEWGYEIVINSSGYYTIALDCSFPWFKNNALWIELDGKNYSVTENRFWNPTFRKRHNEVFFNGYLNAGIHQVKCGAYEEIYGAIVYGVNYGRMGNFNISLTAGEASYKMSLQEFIDVNGNKAKPADSYSVTVETLRQKPDSACIWYDDFRNYSQEYGIKLEDFFDVFGRYNIISSENISGKKIHLNGKCVLKNAEFNDIHVYARWDSGSGKTGVVYGGLFACVNYDSKQLQLWKDDNLISAKDISVKSSFAIALRVINKIVKVYTGTNKVLSIFTELDVSTPSDTGFKSDEAEFSLCRIGSGRWYEPYECYEIIIGEESRTVGRIERNVNWDYDLGVFEVADGKEVEELTSEKISADYDFQCLGRIKELNGKEYEEIDITYKPLDINIRNLRTYIGDGDGFGIMYYNDADSLQYWYNKAIYDYKIRGTCMWSLGQEDCRVWSRIGKKEE